jgi:hypothetical protein
MFGPLGNEQNVPGNFLQVQVPLAKSCQGHFGFSEFSELLTFCNGIDM